MPTKLKVASTASVGIPLAGVLGAALLYKALSHSTKGTANDARQERAMRLAGEADRRAGVNASLRGGARLDPVAQSIYNNEYAANSDPGDWYMFDKGAAAHMVSAGRLMAKQAGIGGAVMGAAKAVGSAIKPGFKTKALIGAGVLGTGLAAAKIGKGVYNYGMKPEEPHVQGGPGANAPTYANQYGVPVM